MCSYKILMKFEQFKFVSFCLGNTSKNKLEDEDHMKKEKGEQKVTNKEEVMCDSYQVNQLHESPAPWPSRPRTEGKKYRLHIVGEVCQRDENEPAKENVIIKGKPIPNIEVILMYGDEQVPASHHLASLRVELVVLEANYYIAGSTDWPREEFENHFFKMVSKTSAPRMTVEKAIFSLDGGRKVHSVASLKESSGKKKVRLGVMAVDDGSVQERVLEGVSSNEFRVIHGRHAVNKQIKRQKTGVSEQNTNVSAHVQSPQKIGQHATGEQPSHARNVCWTQNRPTTPIDAGNIGGAVPPQSNAPNSDQGLAALVHKGIPFEEAYDHRMMPADKPDDNQGHVDPSSQNLMMGINPVHENLQALQPQLSQFGDMLQQGNYGTGGGQGQAGTPQSNNLHTNSQGHITTAAATDDFTSAQVQYHGEPFVDAKPEEEFDGVDHEYDHVFKVLLDAEMGGYEQSGDGGGNNSGRVGDGNNGDLLDVSRLWNIED